MYTKVGLCYWHYNPLVQQRPLQVHSFRHGLLKLLYTINGRIVRWSILDTEMSPDSR